MAINPSNTATQVRLDSLMKQVREGGFHFNKAGLHYLACRANGVKYKKALITAFDAMLAGTMKEVVTAPLWKEVEIALIRPNMPEEAMIIFATGRKPLLSKTGWHEEMDSLLTTISLPDEIIATMPKDKADKIRNARALRERQRDTCIKVMDHLTALYDTANPVVPVEKPEPKAKKVKAEVIPIGKNKQPEPEPTPMEEEFMELYPEIKMPSVGDDDLMDTMLEIFNHISNKPDVDPMLEMMEELESVNTDAPVKAKKVRKAKVGVK